MTRATVKRIRTWVAGWEKKGYPNGIPDEAPENLEAMGRVPSWRLVCVAIMRNDHALQTLGFSRQPCRIYTELKRIEISARVAGKGKHGKELPKQERFGSY